MAVEEVRTPLCMHCFGLSENRLTSRIFLIVLHLGLSEEGQHFPVVYLDLLRTD